MTAAMTVPRRRPRPPPTATLAQTPTIAATLTLPRSPSPRFLVVPTTAHRTTVRRTQTVVTPTARRPRRSRRIVTCLPPHRTTGRAGTTLPCRVMVHLYTSAIRTIVGSRRHIHRRMIVIHRICRQEKGARRGGTIAETCHQLEIIEGVDHPR